VENSRENPSESGGGTMKFNLEVLMIIVAFLGGVNAGISGNYHAAFVWIIVVLAEGSIYYQGKSIEILEERIFLYKKALGVTSNRR